jgi:hypothetical protein
MLTAVLLAVGLFFIFDSAQQRISSHDDSQHHHHSSFITQHSSLLPTLLILRQRATSPHISRPRCAKFQNGAQRAACDVQKSTEIEGQKTQDCSVFTIRRRCASRPTWR